MRILLLVLLTVGTTNSASGESRCTFEKVEFEVQVNQYPWGFWFKHKDIYSKCKMSDREYLEGIVYAQTLEVVGDGGFVRIPAGTKLLVPYPAKQKDRSLDREVVAGTISRDTTSSTQSSAVFGSGREDKMAYCFGSYWQLNHSLTEEDELYNEGKKAGSFFGPAIGSLLLLYLLFRLVYSTAFSRGRAFEQAHAQNVYCVDKEVWVELRECLGSSQVAALIVVACMFPISVSYAKDSIHESSYQHRDFAVSEHAQLSMLSVRIDDNLKGKTSSPIGGIYGKSYLDHCCHSDHNFNSFFGTDMSRGESST